MLFSARSKSLLALLFLLNSIFAALPREAFACSGQAQPDVEGTLLVVQEDDFILPSKVKYAVLTHDAQGNPLKLDIEAPDDASLIPPGLVTGLNVTLHGELAPAAAGFGPGSGDEAGTAKFILNPNPTKSKTGAAIEVQANQPAAAGFELQSVSRKLIVMLIDFNDSAVSCTTTATDNTVFTGAQSVAAVYSRSSYGNVTIDRDSNGDSQADIYRVSIPYSAASASCNYSTWIAAAATAMTNQYGINIYTYDRRLYYLGNGASACGWAGLGTVGGSYGFAIVNGQYCNYGDVAAHELGHNEAMNHSATDTDNNGVLEAEYGDNSDIMGYGGVGMRQFNAPHKIEMGWMPDGNIATVTTNSTLTLTGLEQNTSATQVIKVARAASGGGHYYLSYRIEDGALTSLPSMYKLVTNIHWFSGSGYTYFIRTLSDGQSYSDPVSGISFTQNSHTSTTASVTVTTGASDTTAPTASIASAPSVSANGGTSYSFSVQYSDNAAINVASLGSSNVRVTGPNSFSQLAAFVSVNTNTNGTPRTATYSITPPNGAWSIASNGTYSIAMQGNQVADTSANKVAASTLGSFAVNISDTTIPTATLAAYSNISTPGATIYTFTVQYADNIGVNISTLGAGDIVVTGPNGYSQQAVFLSANINSNGTPRIGSYRITPPGGAWDPMDDGTYTIKMQASQVADLSGNMVLSANLGVFQVATNPNADSDGDGVSDAQELVDGTNPYDRGSGQRSLGTTLCSEWNGFLGGMWNIMELVNLSSHDLQVQIMFYNQSGVQNFNEAITIQPGRQYDALVHDFTGRVLNSYGNVCVTHNGSSGELDGRMVYYKMNLPSRAASGKDFQFAFAMPFSNGKTGKQFVSFNTYQPSSVPGDMNNEVANWLQISNLSGSSGGGVLRFHNIDGTVLGDRRVDLAAGQRFDISGHQFGKSLTGLVEWMPDSEVITYSLRNVRYLYDNGGGEDSFATAFQLEGNYGSGDALSVPLSANGETPILEVSNTRSATVNVTVNVYSNDGTLIQPYVFTLTGYASRHLILDTVIGSGKQAVAIVQGDVAESVVAIGMQYGRNSNGAIRYMYGLAAKSGFGSVLRGSYNTYLSQDSVLLLTNTSAQTQDVSVQLVRQSGQIVQSGIAVSIPGHGVKAVRINDYEAANNYGVVTVQGQTLDSVVAWVERQKGSDYVIPTPVRQ